MCDGVVCRGAGPAVGEPDSRVFTSRAIHASHELPAHTKPTASPTGEWKGPTRRVQGHIHAHNSRCRAPQGQDGPTVRVKAQHCANRHSSPWHRHARLTDYGEQSDRPGTRGSRSPHAGDECVDIVAAEAVSDHLRRHAARSVMWVHGKVAGIGWRARFECAYHRCSRRGCSGRHLMHHLLIQALDSSACAGEAAFFLTSSSSTTSFRKSGFIVA